MKNIILLIVSTTILLSCNQTKKEEKQSIKNEPVKNNVLGKSVSLFVEQNLFKLHELPEAVTVTITNNSDDTITTGLHYQIEYNENNDWQEISPKDMVFHDLGWQLKPTDTEKFEKKLFKDQINYKVGTYRIVKYYLKSDYQKTKENNNVYAEFRIE